MFPLPIIDIRIITIQSVSLAEVDMMTMIAETEDIGDIGTNITNIEEVEAEITKRKRDVDHIVLGKLHHQLYFFWLSFIDVGVTAEKTATEVGGARIIKETGIQQRGIR